MMKLIRLLLLVSALLLSNTTQAGDPKADLKALIEKVNDGIRDGRRTSKSLAAELKEFETTLAKYKGQKTDDVAHILFAKAMLHVEVFEDFAGAGTILKRLKKEYPETKHGKRADEIIQILNGREEALKVQASMKTGNPFPDFQGKDLEGAPLSVGKFKGKIVLVDFWATWCGPCVGEIPNMKKAYQKYHDDGFEIIGISLDRNRAKLESFVTESKLTWPQHFDEGGKLATRYGINAIPATYLVGKDGKIIATNLRGHSLEKAVGEALAGK